ncbi:MULTISPECIES: hypothetical protein [unclassified Polaromonas]|nr:MULTISPECIES: hypothetical protein [unclassified Polaromonas]MDH6186395.1 hypothetical protein [Polaromonas sp. CG_23.6]
MQVSTKYATACAPQRLNPQALTLSGVGRHGQAQLREGRSNQPAVRP